MNVDKVNYNIISIAQPISKTGFTGNIPQATIEKEINKSNTRILRGINKLKNNIGEFQDICINALGTGLLAPIFIKYNPMSKTDEDTRTYSAWRQPLSAVLAILTQGLITIPVVKTIKNMANKGYFSEDCNMTPFKDKNYVEKLMKQMHPQATQKQLTKYVDDYIKSNNSDLNATIQTLKKENTVYYTLRDIFSKDNAGKRVKINPDKYKKLLEQTVDDMLKEEKVQLDRCRGEKFQKRLERSEFYRTHSQEAQQLLEEMKNKITSTNNISDIKDFLKAKQKKLKSEKANQHLYNMVDETRTRVIAGKDEILDKINKMLGHVNKYKDYTSTEQVKKAVEKSVQERITSHTDTIEFLKKVKNAVSEGKTIEYVEKMFTKATKEYQNKATKLGFENTNFRLANKEFSKEVASKLRTLTQKHIEGVKRISTLIAALAILPVGCSLLNWAYPRFMDAVFPTLSNKKHDNESKELVDKATKNSEVE